jgi:tetratricopeptide (TPR) repeat protein
MIKIHTAIISIIWLFITGISSATNTVEDDIAFLQEKWAIINYETAEDMRENAFSMLVDKANEVVKRYPKRAEPLVWKGIILSTYAGAKGGLGALSLVEDARDQLLAAEKIDPKVLNGSIYTSLGSLYYQVPGWPISFGSDNKAEKYLKFALKINPNGIDSNYFYGDFLIEQEKYSLAVTVLEHALKSPLRPTRAIADAGRRVEIEKKILLARKNISDEYKY